MNPIALAGVWGLAKGLAAGRSSARQSNHLGAYLTGPMLEEAMFRIPNVHPGLSSAVFAAVHLTPGMVKKDPVFSGFRFAEVFAGGMMYASAFRRWGFMGAVVAHSLHNIACTLGALISPRPGRPMFHPPHRVKRSRYRSRSVRR